MQLADITSIITSVGVLGTLLLGFMNLYTLRKSEKYSRWHASNTADYERRRDFILEKLSEYIYGLDAHELSFIALTDEEYKGQDFETYKKLYSLETLYYQIKLMTNPDNPCYEELLNILDESFSTAREIRAENVYVEILTNGLRTPEKARKIAEKALELQRREGASSLSKAVADEEVIDCISEAVKNRDEHIRSFLSAAERLTKQKEVVVSTAQKYLIEEKKLLLSNRGGSK